MAKPRPLQKKLIEIANTIYKAEKPEMVSRDVSGTELIWENRVDYVPGLKLYVYLDRPSYFDSAAFQKLVFTVIEPEFDWFMAVYPDKRGINMADDPFAAIILDGFNTYRPNAETPSFNTTPAAMTELYIFADS